MDIQKAKDEEPMTKAALIHYLLNNGYTDVFATEDKYDYKDVVAYKDDEEYVFEIKNRDIPTTQYGDAIIDLSKYNKLKRHKNAYLVVFYTDDKVAIIDLHQQHCNIFVKRCQNNNEDKIPVDKLVAQFILNDTLLYPKSLFNK